MPGVQKYFQAPLDHQNWEGQTPSKQQLSIPAVSSARIPFTALQPLWKALYPLCSRGCCPSHPLFLCLSCFHPSHPLSSGKTPRAGKAVCSPIPLLRVAGSPDAGEEHLAVGQHPSSCSTSNTRTVLPVPRLSSSYSCLTSLPQPRRAPASLSHRCCEGQVLGSV